MRILTTPWKKELTALARDAEKSIDIAVPFLSFSTLEDVFENTSSKKNAVDLRFIVRLSGSDFLQGIADYRVYEWLAKKTRAKALRNLHAKVYIFNQETAIVTSSNLTEGGLQNNEEMGILIEDTEIVENIKRHFGLWWDNSIPINLRELNPLVDSLKDIDQKQLSKEDKTRQKIARQISRLASPVRPEPIEDETLTTIEEDDYEFIKETLIPQADDLAKVADVPVLIANRKTTPVEFAKSWGVVNRQGDYYGAAACALKLAQRTKKAGAYEYALTPLGKMYVDARQEDRRGILRQALINAPVVRAAAKGANVDLGTLLINEKQDRRLTNKQVVAAALKRELKDYLRKDSTFERRAQTITSWIRWLLDMD